MGMGWVTLLAKVPWSEVLDKAPGVVDGAKKLWKKVGNKASGATDVASSRPTGSVDERIDQLHAQVVQLQSQLLAGNEVIQSLAEQNAQLIARVETMRRRVLALAALTVAIGGLALYVALAGSAA